MDFFNRLGERAKEFGDKAKEATRRPTELIELTKLRYEVTKLSKVMENNKEAIGELVYRQFKGEMGLEGEIERLLQNTKKMEADIVEMERKIEKLQPKPLVCPRCEIELPSDGVYCYKCGIRVAAEQSGTPKEEGGQENPS
ncbi:tRNA(Ile2) C34 agmatinyltransferase TiaS [Desulfohalotomaculum tongense]|uniref:zinc ribbon domain-containing protein n=1 Tax=Desulforadius tongensis TaxID=1216062 RepID=UPI001958CD16|nr:zinc ribbon domain-containing protein [Desulforadius tongensis]MBM7854820.1 tRNA(Ile2) C34 agmatinyltransferase TiaS [Desulforadius tongensis]